VVLRGLRTRPEELVPGRLEKTAQARSPIGSFPRVGSLAVKRSSSGYAETLARLHAGIERRQLTVFAQVDHASGAREAGLELEDEIVVLLGSPRAGTPLMQADRRIGIELPLRILVWREGGDVLVGHQDPRELAGSYEVSSLAPTLEAMASLLDELTAEAAG
jgi:uncharacterized protein (DUF302 family)